MFLAILNIDIVEDAAHLITGGLLAYVGFSRVDLALARNVALGLGVVYLLVGLLGFVVPTMFGLLPDAYTAFDNLLPLALGVLSIAVAYVRAGRGASHGALVPSWRKTAVLAGPRGDGADLRR